MVKKSSIKPLPLVVGRYFDIWIKRGTWHTEHLNDNAYFYKFVKAVLRYCKKGKRPSDSLVRRWIELKGRETLGDSEYLRVNARRFSSLYADILEFHDTAFPDGLIERTSPCLCYFILKIHGADESEIDHWMQKSFGEDWRRKLEEDKKRIG